MNTYKSEHNFVKFLVSLLMLFCVLVVIIWVTLATSTELVAGTQDCKHFKTTKITFNKHYDCGSYYKVCYDDICRRHEK